MRCLTITTSLAIAVAAVAQSQQLTVDPKTSLAWWQMNPHLGHLWATTCPQDPSWMPGESRGAGFKMDNDRVKEVPIIQVEDPRVPIYPRDTVHAVCSEAITGTVIAPDTVRWTGVRGFLSIHTEYLFNGMPMRDAYARKAVYKTSEHPDVRFVVDSLVNVRRERDTIHADAVGSFEFRGVRQPMTVPVEAWREPEGLRVRGKFTIPAPELVSIYGVSKFALGLSLGTHIWKQLHMGFDVVLKPRAGAARGGQ